MRQLQPPILRFFLLFCEKASRVPQHTGWKASKKLLTAPEKAMQTVGLSKAPQSSPPAGGEKV